MIARGLSGRASSVVGGWPCDYCREEVSHWLAAAAVLYSIALSIRRMGHAACKGQFDLDALGNPLGGKIARFLCVATGQGPADDGTR